MNGPVRRLSIGLFAGFFALLLAVTWTQVIHADVLKADPRNSRPALSERGKERGLIVTIDGTVVAESVPIPKTPLVHPPVSRGGALRSCRRLQLLPRRILGAGERLRR